MSFSELSISQWSQVIEDTTEPFCLPEKLSSITHEPSPSGGHVLYALASVLAHSATKTGQA